MALVRRTHCRRRHPRVAYSAYRSFAGPRYSFSNMLVDWPVNQQESKTPRRAWKNAVDAVVLQHVGGHHPLDAIDSAPVQPGRFSPALGRLPSPLGGATRLRYGCRDLGTFRAGCRRRVASYPLTIQPSSFTLYLWNRPSIHHDYPRCKTTCTDCTKSDGWKDFVAGCRASKDATR